jgi:hypothetical protein
MLELAAIEVTSKSTGLAAFGAIPIFSDASKGDHPPIPPVCEAPIAIRVVSVAPAVIALASLAHTLFAAGASDNSFGCGVCPVPPDAVAPVFVLALIVTPPRVVDRNEANTPDIPTGN